MLSGTGSDGPQGVAAVKEAGGTVVFQDPSSAAFPALPASIAPVNVDMVADIDTLGPLLVSMIADGEPSARKLDDDVLRGFLLQLRSRSGIDFTQYKSPTIKRRLARLMAAARCSTLADYMRYLNAHPEAYHRLVSSFSSKSPDFSAIRPSTSICANRCCRRSSSMRGVRAANCGCGRRAAPPAKKRIRLR